MLLLLPLLVLVLMTRLARLRTHISRFAGKSKASLRLNQPTAPQDLLIAPVQINKGFVFGQILRHRHSREAELQSAAGGPCNGWAGLEFTDVLTQLPHR